MTGKCQAPGCNKEPTTVTRFYPLGGERLFVDVIDCGQHPMRQLLPIAKEQMRVWVEAKLDERLQEASDGH